MFRNLETAKTPDWSMPEMLTPTQSLTPSVWPVESQEARVLCLDHCRARYLATRDYPVP